MDPITALATANAAIGLVELLIPQIAKLFEKGEITKEQQQEVLKNLQSLKDRAAGQFQGPEWEIVP